MAKLKARMLGDRGALIIPASNFEEAVSKAKSCGVERAWQEIKFEPGLGEFAMRISRQTLSNLTCPVEVEEL